jgi:hypothetical protein
VCLQKDTLILSEDFSHLYEYNFNYPEQCYLPRLLEALGPEKCFEIHQLALEVRTNWQYGRYKVEDWHLFPWQRPFPHASTTTAQVFPKLEKIIYVPCIAGHYKYKYPHSLARMHVGELEFVPRQSGLWVKGRKKWANQLPWEFSYATRNNIRDRDLEYEVMQLGIVGGKIKLDSNPDSDTYFSWRLMTKEEVQIDEARQKDIEQKRRKRLGLEPLP